MNAPVAAVIVVIALQHSVDHEQGLQKRLSRVVRSDVHCTPPRKNSASCLIGARHAASAVILWGHSFVQGLIWWFVMARIGQDLRERFQVPEQLQSKLLVLVRKLDDRDLLFPSVSSQKDVDLFGG